MFTPEPPAISRLETKAASRGLFGVPTAFGAQVSAFERRRALRVWMLMLAIVLMSVADLYMTLTHLNSVGMGEANPIARWVIGYGSPWLLGIWKFGCIGLACLIFAIARHRWSGEVACWACFAVLTGLTLHWMAYSAEASALTPQMHLIAAGEASNWVRMGN